MRSAAEGAAAPPSQQRVARCRAAGQNGRFVRTLALVLAALLAGACSTPAAGARGDAPAPAALRSGRPVDPAAVLGPYPPAGSEAAKADLAIVLWLQRTRTAEDVARATREVKLDLDTFAAALGPRFDPAAHPRTRSLVEHVYERAGGPVREGKQRFARPRPYQADERVSPAVEREPTFSYPSGHATRGVLLARVLAELAPSRREALLETGERVGYDRVVGGVHYPTDVLGGQRLGEALADAFLASPELRAEIVAVRAAEWRGE